VIKGPHAFLSVNGGFYVGDRATVEICGLVSSFSNAVSAISHLYPLSNNFHRDCLGTFHRKLTKLYNTLSEAWSGVKWADLMAAFGTDFYDRSTRTIVGAMLWTEYR